MTSTDLQLRINKLRQRYLDRPRSKVFAPLADLLRQTGQLEEALVLLEDGLAMHPGYMSGMVVLGHTLFDAGRQDHGRKVLARVIDLDPENFVALGMLVEDACENQDWRTARSWLEDLRRLDPDNPRWEKLWGLTNVQTVPDAGPGEEAPDEPQDKAGFATLSMVDVYVAQGYLSKALAALRLIHAREPGNPEVRERMARVLARMDESTEDGKGAAPLQENAEGSGSRPASPDKGEPRHLEMARQRARRKQHFNDWVNRLQDPEGGNS